MAICIHIVDFLGVTEDHAIFSHPEASWYGGKGYIPPSYPRTVHEVYYGIQRIPRKMSFPKHSCINVGLKIEFNQICIIFFKGYQFYFQ